MTTGSTDHPAPPRPPSSASTNSSTSSTSSKHVRCIGRYVLTGDTLGKGNFARVDGAIHTLTKTKVAIKIIEIEKIKEEYVKKNLLREAQLMRRLRHPNIIRLYETMKTNTIYCLVTEIAEGGEMLLHVRNDCKDRKMPEPSVRNFIRQLVSALDYLHSSGIVHRDLKMENILLDKKKRSVKIVDFGLSNAQKPGALLQTHCGSPEYAAPELFIPGREYGPEVDVWSLGVNMYAMLVGRLPFRSPRQGTKRRQKLLEQISSGLSETHHKEMEHLSAGAIDLIGRLLQPNAKKRAQLLEVMGHPWITKDGLAPMAPYKTDPPDLAIQTAVMDLMSSVLDVSFSEIKETVKRDRCDWLAAIYNLLLDYPEGRTALQKMMTDERSQSVGSSQESLNGVSGFSQGLSQDVLDLTEAGLIQPVKKTTSAHPRIVDHSGGLTPNHHQSPPQHLSSPQPQSPSSQDPLTPTRLSSDHKKRHSSSDHSDDVFSSGMEYKGHRYTKHSHSNNHRTTLTAPALSIRRASVANTGLSPDHVSGPSHLRKLPQPPSYDQPEVVSPAHHQRRESAPHPLPAPFRATIAPPKQLQSKEGESKRHPSQSNTFEPLSPPASSWSVQSPRGTPSMRNALSQDIDSTDGGYGHPGYQQKRSTRPHSTSAEYHYSSPNPYGGSLSQQNPGGERPMYTAWKGHKRHVVGPKYASGSAGRYSQEHSNIPIPSGWSSNSPTSSSAFGGSLKKLSQISQGASTKPPVELNQSFNDLRQHPASQMTSEHHHGMGLEGSPTQSGVNESEFKMEIFTPRPNGHGYENGTVVSSALSQDSAIQRADDYHQSKLRKPKSMEQMKHNIPRPKTVSTSGYQSHHEQADLMSPSDRLVSTSQGGLGKHRQLPSIEKQTPKRPSSSHRSRSLGGFLGRALKITSFKSKNGDK